MKVLIYGGRQFGASQSEYRKGMQFITRIAEERFPRHPPDEFGNYLFDVTILSGGARGADNLGEEWATVEWAQLERFPADWKRDGLKAGPLRNERMLREGRPDLAIEFPGGKGTADMRRRLDAAGIEVIEFQW